MEERARAAFTVTVSLRDYMDAARVASRVSGHLSASYAEMAAVMISAFAGVFALRRFPFLAILLMIGAVIFCVFLGLRAMRRVDEKAHWSYHAFHHLLTPSQVSIYEDYMTISGEQFSRRDSYALLVRMVETPTLFVFVRADETFAVLPKHDMPMDGGQVYEFLRTVFARKYTRQR